MYGWFSENVHQLMCDIELVALDLHILEANKIIDFVK